MFWRGAADSATNVLRSPQPSGPSSSPAKFGLDGPIFAAAMARDQVDAEVVSRQVDLRANARRDFAQQPHLFQRDPILGRGLQIDLREPLEGVALVLGEGKGARALAEILRTRSSQR